MELFTALMRITPNYKAGPGIALHGINLLDSAAICNQALVQEVLIWQILCLRAIGLSEVRAANVSY